MAPPKITDYGEIQNDEIDALRSIYMEDFIEGEAKTGAWNKAVDRTFRIRLKAVSGDEDQSICLVVALPSTYPKSLPYLTLEFGSNLNQKTRSQCTGIIKAKPKLLVGSEMIFEIASALQETLDGTMTANEALPLDEERALREKAASEKAKMEHDLEKQRELKMQQEEETLLQDLVAQRQARSAHRSIRTPSTPGGGSTGESLPPGVLKFDQPSCSIKSPEGHAMSVAIIHHKTGYRQGPVCKLATVWPFHQGQGPNEFHFAPFLILKECQVRLTDAGEPALKRAIQNLELQIEYHMALREHPNIIKPLNFHIQKVLHENESQAIGWNISILTELVGKGSLRDTLAIVGKLDVSLARAWSIQLLEGLHHYHRHSLAHASVHLGNVLLHRDREAEKGEQEITVAALSDGGYGLRLHTLKTGNCSRHYPPGWTAPEMLDSTASEKATAGTDIWSFGCCFLQMAFGMNVVTDYSLGPMSLMQDFHLTASLRALITQMFHSNPRRRSSAWDLLHSEFFRSDDALFEKDPSCNSSLLETSLAALPTSRSRRESTPASAISSRYVKDFAEDGRLGRGGFGEVFRARHKIDGQLYAIKKIKAQSKNALNPVLSEVSVLSRLNHPNVVRYFASWVEDGVSAEQSDLSQSSVDEYATSLTGSERDRSVPQASSKGLDFISSSNAQVIFAADDIDGETSTEEEDTNTAYDSETDGVSSEVDGQDLSSSVHDSTAPEAMKAPMQAQRTSTILYIQMQYCRQDTLRDLINSGLQANVNEIWRLLRQIVQGLAHIHGLSIVHRDLKPENIFIDGDGDVRIGDFGLARPGDYRTVLIRASTGTDTAREGFGSFTRDVGTASYTAPEVRSAGNGKYNEKADMFSLGVILLEMSVPFSTGMERAEALEQLHKEFYVLPSVLQTPETATQAKFILSLVQAKPSSRPSSSELLESGEIPYQAEDESLRVARRLLNDRTSHYRTQFIGSLFSQSDETRNLDSTRPSRDPIQAITLLEDVGAMSASSSISLDFQSMVKEKLTAVFQRHGAVERTDSPALFPYCAFYSTDDVFRFVSSTGKVMQLPYDLILPNAMLLAKQIRPDRRTFVFGDVYRVDQTRHEPRIFKEANFDIVSGRGDNLALREAEVLKVVDEILDTFPNFSSAQMCYHINHSHLLNHVLRFCDIDPPKWPLVKESISKLHFGDFTWAKIRYELRGSTFAVAATSLDELERFDFHDTWERVIPRLRSIFKDTTHLEATFAHLQSVLDFLGRLGVKRKVYINPLSSYNQKFYEGSLLFQCLYDQKRRSIFAAGGRYDQLIADHQPLISRRAHIHAVGCQFAWTGLCSDTANYLKRIAKSKAKQKGHGSLTNAWRTRRCDVLVKSFDKGLLESAGVEIVRELWTNDISSEVAESNTEGLSDNIFTKTQDRTDKHNWIVLIKASDFVKVKNITRDDEVELKVPELVPYIRSEIRERDRNQERGSKISLPRLTSQPESTIPSNDRDADVQILMSQNKGKKVNRKTIVEEAKTQRRAYLQGCADSPIVAIETKDDTFDGIAETRLSDPESWRKFIQSAAPGERQYLGQLQNMLKGMAKEATTQEGGNTAIVYNFRTKACISYNLGRAA
ncbi:eukaryotic translation initiation factor 2-alpha kinase [Lecanora helva]